MVGKVEKWIFGGLDEGSGQGRGSIGGKRRGLQCREAPETFIMLGGVRNGWKPWGVVTVLGGG